MKRSTIQTGWSSIVVLLSVGLFFAGCTQSPQSGNRVVSAGDNELTIAAEHGKAELTYDVAPDAKITLDARPVRLEDLDAGDAVHVDIDQREGEHVAMKVTATSREKLDTSQRSHKEPAPQVPMIPPL